MTTGYEAPDPPKPVNKRWVLKESEHFMESHDALHAVLYCNDEPRGLIKLLAPEELLWLNKRLERPQLIKD